MDVGETEVDEEADIVEMCRIKTAKSLNKVPTLAMLTQAFRDTAKCTICHEDYEETGDKRPRQLVPCNHLVCELCFERIPLHPNYGKQCPICRATITAHNNGLQQYYRAMRDQLNGTPNVCTAIFVFNFLFLFLCFCNRRHNH